MTAENDHLVPRYAVRLPPSCLAASSTKPPPITRILALQGIGSSALSEMDGLGIRIGRKI